MRSDAVRTMLYSRPAASARALVPLGQLHPDRHVLLGGRAVAELAVGVDAPGQYPAIGGQGERLEYAGRGRRHLDARGQPDLGRRPADLRGAVAEPAMGVVAPGQEPPGGGDRVTGRVARRDGSDLRVPGYPHVAGDEPEGGRGAGAQLAVNVPAPGQHPARLGQGQGAVQPRADGRDRDALGQPDPHRERLVLAGPVAQLPVEVVPPGQDLALGGQRQGEQGAFPHRCYLHAGGQPDPHGRQPGHGRAVADLAVDVAAPGEDRPGGGQRHAGALRGPHRGVAQLRGQPAYRPAEWRRWLSRRPARRRCHCPSPRQSPRDRRRSPRWRRRGRPGPPGRRRSWRRPG